MSAVTPAHAPKGKKRKKKKSKKKRSALLSFGGDEEEDPEFQVKKMRGDLTFEKKKKKKKKKKKEKGDSAPSFGNRAYLQSSAGMYTAEGLAALKKNAIHMSTGAEDEGGAGAQESETPRDQNEREVRTEMEVEREKGGSEDLARKEEVLAARRKRERIRQMGDGARAADYIPLGGKKGDGKIGGKVFGVEDDNEHGGLVTENPDDDEIDVFSDQKGSRIKMHDPGKPRGVIDDDSKIEFLKGHKEDEDDEYNKWIEDQIRAGGARVHKNKSYTAITQGGVAGSGKYRPSVRKENTYDVEAEMKRLSVTFESLKENSLKTARDMNNLDREIKNTDQELEKYQSDLKAMNTQYLFYQSLRDKITDCLDCLNTKAPLIEEAMEEMKELETSKAKAIRRAYDLYTRDEAEEAFGPLEPQKKEMKEVDEFGRDVGAINESGKEARREAREKIKKRIKGTGPEAEGYWSDDGGDLVRTFSHRKKRLGSDVAEIFSDAADDFKSVDTVKMMLEKFKIKYPQSYTDTYISLSVPSLFAPYVRLELLAWDFLKEPRLSAMPWYGKLANYGLFGDITQDDPDLDVVPKIVEKVVTPHLTHFFFTSWDPLSSKSLPSSLELVREVLEHVDGKLPNPQKLLGTVLDRFHDLVNTHRKYPLKPVVQSKSHLQWRFCEKRWWRALKILEQLLNWRQLISKSVIQDLGLSHLEDNLIPFLVQELTISPPRVGLALNALAKLYSLLPPEWCDKSEARYRKLYKAVKDYYAFCKAKRVASDDLRRIKSLVK